MDTNSSYKLTVSFRKGDVRRNRSFKITIIKGDCVYAIPDIGGVEDFLFVYLKNIFTDKSVKNAIQKTDSDLKVTLLFEKGNYQEKEQFSFQKSEETYEKLIEIIINKIINKYLEFHHRYNHRLKSK